MTRLVNATFVVLVSTIFVIAVIQTFPREWLPKKRYEPIYRSEIHLFKNYSTKDLKKLNKDIVKPPLLKKGVLKSCPGPNERKLLFKLLKWWIDFSAEHEFVWWIIAGSLLGQYRWGKFRLSCRYCFCLLVNTLLIFMYMLNH